jgi:hypothetical protein
VLTWYVLEAEYICGKSDLTVLETMLVMHSNCNYKNHTSEKPWMNTSRAFAGPSVYSMS